MIRVAKYLLTVFVLVFMVAIYISGTTPSTPMSEVAEKMAALPATQALESENSQKIARFLDLYPEDYKELHYWKTTDGMNTSELVVAEAEDATQMATIKAAILQRVSDQKTAFQGYAPEQEAKLNNYVLKTQGNYLFYAVGTDEELAAWEGAYRGI